MLATDYRFNIVDECRDIARVNAVVNHPSVVDGLSLGLSAPINLAPLFDDPETLCFMGDHGGALLHWNAPGVYDIHDFVLPEGRGAWARDAAREIFATMWSRGAVMLWCRTPAENRASRMFNRILGFKSQGVALHTLVPGQRTPCETFVMVNPCL